ncbi:hypothetical protein HK407_02g03710 [Ordospora pajunii]|jgi:hypothetical protein|uniref:uncharacterized protein n=1 Tax=Ordospora pajunii TaxID=3039483 RepID=UPI0029528787|nr:uncharacterized protein HK407_02g03710 [Ordospora pajunii]KAH9411926.1 hypothetical protein HK407_02g03710 [Ordospora pajunii]
MACVYKFCFSAGVIMSVEGARKPATMYGMLRMAFIGIAVGVGIYYVLLFLFGVVFLDPEYYGSYMYAWRVNYADKPMTHGRYKLINELDYPSTEERQKFYELAQGRVEKADGVSKEVGEAYLIRFNRPEHYPRGFDHHSSLNFSEYESFLKLREKFICESENLKVDESLTHAQLRDMMKTKKTVGGEMFFSDYKGKSIDYMMNTLPESKNDPWYEVGCALINAVSGILSLDADRRVKYMFDGTKVGEGLRADIKAGMSALNEPASKESGEQLDKVIDEFFVHNGRVCASPYETYAYSRMYYMFSFLTAGLEFSVPNFKESDKESNEFREARMEYVANIFARIVSSVYPNGNKKDVSDIGLVEKLRNKFSPMMSVDAEKEVSEADLELVRRSFEEAAKKHMLAEQ